MASLIVNNVVSSSVEISYNYHNTDELFGYTVRGNYTIDVSDIRIQEGDTVLLSGRDAIKDAYGRPNIVARIGADDYLNGRISTYSLGESTLVGSETITVSIEESRRLDDYAASEFAKYIPNPHHLASFVENYNFNRNGPTYSSTRNISITYKQAAGEQFLNDAKTFLTNYYFANRPDLGYQEDGISENAKISKNYRGVLKETYDLIGLKVALTESVSSSFVDDSKGVGKNERQRLETSPEGYSTKTHEIQLTSLRRNSENVLTTAISEIIDEKNTLENDEFGPPIAITKGITKDGNTASLSITFTNDPNKSGDTRESYSGSQQKAGKFTEYGLTILYKANGPNNREKFLNAKRAWVAGQPLNQERIQRLFHSKVPIYEKNRSTNFQKTSGQVSETITFTTDSAYKEEDDGVLKVKKTLSKTHQINRINKFLDLTSLREQVSVRSLKTVGQASVSAEAVVSQSMGIYAAKDALEARTSEFDELVDEDIIHITSDVIRLSLGNGTASRTLNYLFLSNG